MSENAISVNNLYRYFGSLKAVDGISFEVPHGSVCGFVGANGAGKTTTMRMLATLDYPTMGQARDLRKSTPSTTPRKSAHSLAGCPTILATMTT